MSGPFPITRTFAIGERKPVSVTLHGDGRIEMRQAGKAQPVVTTVDRAYFSALRTKALNAVRDRERTARYRMNGRKAVAR
jgi:hypothetical protein